MANAKSSKTESTTAIEPLPEGGALAEVAPDFISGGGAGFEEVSTKDIQMPMLLIAQAMSPQRKKADPAFIEGLEEGDLFHSVDGRIFGKGPLVFSIVKAGKARWVEFDEKTRKIIDGDVPEGDPRTEFGADGSKPKATKFLDFVIMARDGQNVQRGELMALSFKGMSLRAGKRLNSLAFGRQTKSGARADIFAGLYTVKAAQMTNEKGTFGIYTVGNGGWPDGEWYKRAADTFKALRDKNVIVDREPGEDDGDPADTGASQM